MRRTALVIAFALSISASTAFAEKLGTTYETNQRTLRSDLLNNISRWNASRLYRISFKSARKRRFQTSPTQWMPENVNAKYM